MANIPLHVLDEYAKTLSEKQVKKLYEVKCHKKYVKPLYENMKYQSKSNYYVYLTHYILNEAKSSIENVLINYVNKYNLQHNIVNEGVYLYTKNRNTYEALIHDLTANGFNKSLLENVVNKENKKIIKLL